MKDRYFIHTINYTQVRIVPSYKFPLIRNGEWRIADFTDDKANQLPMPVWETGKTLIKWLSNSGYREMTDSEEAKFTLTL